MERKVTDAACHSNIARLSIGRAQRQRGEDYGASRGRVDNEQTVLWTFTQAACILGYWTAARGDSHVEFISTAFG